MIMKQDQLYPIVLPAMSKAKEVEIAIQQQHKYIVLLGGQLTQMKPLVQLARRYGINVIVLSDLIQGLKNDDYGVDYLIQDIAPYGIISTRANVVLRAKQKGVLAIQRMFLLDSEALERSFSLIEKISPDYIEVLPGIIPEMIEEVKLRTNIPVIAGGLIRHKRHVRAAIQAGASMVTTSRQELWEYKNEGEL